MAKTVVIPTYVKPYYTVMVNGKKYTYPSGQAVELPDGIAEIVENDIALDPRENPAAKQESAKALKALIERTITEFYVPEGITQLGAYAFGYCQNLKSITIPEGVTVLSGSTFNNCTALEEVVIPASVETVFNNCFNVCTALKKVTFLGTPKLVQDPAFNKCTALVDIYVPWAEGEVADAPWGATNAVIHYGVK